MTPQTIAEAVVNDGTSYTERLTWAMTPEHQRMPVYFRMCSAEMRKLIYAPHNWPFPEDATAVKIAVEDLSDSEKGVALAAIEKFLRSSPQGRQFIWEVTALKAAAIVDAHMQAHIKEL